MATFAKIPLSGSTDGKPILVDDAATPGKTIHTSSSSSGTTDEVWLYAMNTGSAAVKLTIEWGGATAGFLIEQTIPAESGLVLVAPGLLMKGNASTWTCAAFAANATDVNITGYVNRIS